jgi:hypothetical protein
MQGGQKFYFYTLNKSSMSFLTNIKIINLAMRWQENVEQTLTEKKMHPLHH